MQDYGTVMGRMERTVFHVESGTYLPTLTEAIIYQQPRPVLVLMRQISMRNATAATGSYTLISGATLEEWKQSMEESTSMHWKPLPPQGSGLDLNWN